MLQLILAGAILVNIPYGMTIMLYLAVRTKLERKQGAFHLGRFEVPVAVTALAWPRRCSSSKPPAARTLRISAWPVQVMSMPLAE